MFVMAIHAYNVERIGCKALEKPVWDPCIAILNDLFGVALGRGKQGRRKTAGILCAGCWKRLIPCWNSGRLVSTVISGCHLIRRRAVSVPISARFAAAIRELPPEKR